MTETDRHGRIEPPAHADEVTSLTAFVDFHRGTIDWRTRDLDAAGLATTVAASSMTLGGLLTHLAFVEDYWLSHRLHGNAPAAPWDTVDWDRDWHLAAELPPDQPRAMWLAAVERSRGLVAEAVARGGLELPAALPGRTGETPSLRWILLHLLEEYARHVGHADLIREAIDGQTGQ